MTRADLDKRPGDVAAMFDALAGRYDLMNDILSAGQVRLWRRAVTRILKPAPGETILDLAAGTGTSTQAFARVGANAVACDFSLGMLRAGKRRTDPQAGVQQAGAQHAGAQHAGAQHAGAQHAAAQHAAAQHAAAQHAGAQRMAFAAGDALRLPFSDDSFDAATISFGLRNVADPGQGLAEMRRVTRPGGRLVVCEFSRITIKSADAVYRRYLLDIIPKIAHKAARNPDAYVYLAESILAWPSQPELAKMIEAAGWRSVRWRELSLGIVAVHVARKPGGKKGATPAGIK
jgi:demethylmenaquinone methyltransferase / 2-methoxy-6-polyprenyl-1,4-benzoquinol methylase